MQCYTKGFGVDTVASRSLVALLCVLNPYLLEDSLCVCVHIQIYILIPLLFVRVCTYII